MLAKMNSQTEDWPAQHITIHIQVPEHEMCDTMWENCDACAVCVITEDIGNYVIRAARCSKHLLQELPQAFALWKEYRKCGTPVHGDSPFF
jgi:hypothetical protein